MATKQAVAAFLHDFHIKLKIWDVFFRDDRGKNSQALADLEITPIARKKIIEELTFQDYSEGPLSDELNLKSDMWVFGKSVKQVEVYIKITMGYQNSGVICISFHPAEKGMQFPHKK